MFRGGVMQWGYYPQWPCWQTVDGNKGVVCRVQTGALNFGDPEGVRDPVAYLMMNDPDLTAETEAQIRRIPGMVTAGWGGIGVILRGASQTGGTGQSMTLPFMRWMPSQVSLLVLPAGCGWTGGNSNTSLRSQCGGGGSCCMAT